VVSFCFSERAEIVNEDNPLGSGGAVAKLFASSIRAIWSMESGPFYPNHFNGAVKTVNQNHEPLPFLFASILDVLHEDWKSTAGKDDDRLVTAENSFIHDLFALKTSRLASCSEGHSQEVQSHLLYFDLFQEPEKGDQDLIDMFQYHWSRDDMWYCAPCGKLCETYSSPTYITHFPKALVLLINRDPSTFSCEVDFPEELRLDEFADPSFQGSPTYSLIGICVRRTFISSIIHIFSRINTEILKQAIKQQTSSVINTKNGLSQMILA